MIPARGTILQLQRREVTCAASERRGRQASPPGKGKPSKQNNRKKKRTSKLKIYYEFLRGPSTLKLLFISFHENNDNARAIVRDLTFP
jgi:hypothetical protein